MDLTLRGPAYEWALWSTTVRVAVADPHALPSARRLVDHELAAVELAASRFRADSEVRRLAHRGGRPTRISPTLAALLEAALSAAGETGGAVDPTLGNALAGLGYDRDFGEMVRSAGADGFSVRVVRRLAPGWRRVELDLDALTVQVPPDVQLDLGATAKAWAADRCARVVADTLGLGVLVSLGGDIATAGPAPRRGWQVLVQDQPDDPAALVALPAGAALATSSTRSRQWQRDGRELHHVLDPATCEPVEPVWRWVSVVAGDCLTANTWSTAALVLGRQAPGALAAQRLQARLVAEGGAVHHLGDWPVEAEVSHGIPVPA
ncbi:FAD:protein FMN transferase [Oryzihumus leptocrescens]|uniref:FAD:protein FMN transferase n=1 Tax=Oryzihumus leptocrescens TaxID=297536 RepID=A0A542Z9E6_9MICO|nr:FAD:protein FMN transferase [Oryzihumus leptocrescens]TQL56951.1 thiamine biosynthesis lipoprotein [Oryzihumus leptocrescens]